MPIAIIRRAVSVPIGFLKIGLTKGPQRRLEIKAELSAIYEEMKTASPIRSEKLRAREKKLREQLVFLERNKMFGEN